MKEINRRYEELKMIFDLFGGNAIMNIKGLIWMSYRMIIFGKWGNAK